MRSNSACAGMVLAFFCIAGTAFGQTADNQPANNVFVVNYLPSQIELNPMKSFSSTEAQIFTAIYEGLVTYNPLTMKPVPGVAAYWEVSPDGKMYTFHLRQDALYWNGDQVTAQDFRNSWLELLNPENHSPYSFLLDVVKGAENYRKGINKDPNSVGIHAISKTILEVQLAHPAAQFLDILCHHSFVPVHPSMLKFGDWSKLPSVIGNGAYYIVKKSDSEIDLAKNDLYWDASNVHIPYIHITFRNDAAAVTRDFNEGKIQWIAGGILLDKVQNKDSVVINQLFATTYFYFNASVAPWNDPRVRKALVELLPLEEMRSTKYQYIPATTLVPPIPYYPSVKGITKTDKTDAMKLLSEAGFPDGKGLPSITIQVPQGSEDGGMAGLIAKAWNDALGIEVKIANKPYQQYVDNLSKDNYTLATLTWIGDFADPLTFLQMWTTGSNLNDAHYSDTTFNNYVTQSLGESGIPRYELLGKAEEELLSGGEVIPLSHSPAINVIDLTQIDGWYPNPLDIHPFKYLQFAALKPLKGIVKAQGTGPLIADAVGR
ncbi:MAG TPA: peptide ABC transporter substrate-binding protein [Spirochaetia bacterium]|nr:peptide ABC transporter substrate-binding protein [Spirochaetia bacterium]